MLIVTGEANTVTATTPEMFSLVAKVMVGAAADCEKIGAAADCVANTSELLKGPDDFHLVEKMIEEFRSTVSSVAHHTEVMKAIKNQLGEQHCDSLFFAVPMCRLAKATVLKNGLKSGMRDVTNLKEVVDVYSAFEKSADGLEQALGKMTHVESMQKIREFASVAEGGKKSACTILESTISSAMLKIGNKIKEAVFVFDIKKCIEDATSHSDQWKNWEEGFAKIITDAHMKEIFNELDSWDKIKPYVVEAESASRPMQPTDAAEYITEGRKFMCIASFLQSFFKPIEKSSRAGVVMAAHKKIVNDPRVPSIVKRAATSMIMSGKQTGVPQK